MWCCCRYTRVKKEEGIVSGAVWDVKVKHGVIKCRADLEVVQSGRCEDVNMGSSYRCIVACSHLGKLYRSQNCDIGGTTTSH